MLHKKLRKQMRKKLGKNSMGLSRTAHAELADSLAREDEKSEMDAINLAVRLMRDIYDKSNKHYRVYFEDELEHDETIFDPKRPIFYNADIKRG